MILVDLQQTAIANFYIYHQPKPDRGFVDVGYGEDDLTEVELMRNHLLRALRSYRRKFGEKYGDFVLCCDSDKSWRKDMFPFYKIRRRQKKQGSAFDFKTFNDTFTIIKDEFRTCLPYKLVEADGAEGDDVIAVMCEWNASRQNKEPVLIYSSDRDFLQLQRFPLVEQYDKFNDRFLPCPDPLQTVRELIIRGDDDDDVPNILSEDNCFAAKVRQKPMMTAKVDVWKTQDPETITEWDEATRERYQRNKRLVDLSMVPAEVKKRIALAYLNHQPVPRANLYKYLMRTKSSDLVGSAGEF